MPPMTKKDCSLLNLIADNIRQNRGILHISQEELADRAGVHRTYIGMLERAEKNVTVLSLEKIAMALKIPLESLFRKGK